VRIERRKVESSHELRMLVGEALEGEIEGLRIIDGVESGEGAIEAGLLVSNADGRVIIVASKERTGDDLILSYGRHLSWLEENRERLASSHPDLKWDQPPGLFLLAESFGPHALLVGSMLALEPWKVFTMKCLGIGGEKGLYLEPVSLPAVRREAPEPAGAPDLVSRAVSGIFGVAEGLSVSASFGYVSESLDYAQVANLNTRGGNIWIESGPGKWTTTRIENEDSLEKALKKVRESYEEVIRMKGKAKDLREADLSEAERDSLRWE
jgi:hypothetical protein